MVFKGIVTLFLAKNITSYKNIYSYGPRLLYPQKNSVPESAKKNAVTPDKVCGHSRLSGTVFWGSKTYSQKDALFFVKNNYEFDIPFKAHKKKNLVGRTLYKIKKVP